MRDGGSSIRLAYAVLKVVLELTRLSCLFPIYTECDADAVTVSIAVCLSRRGPPRPDSYADAFLYRSEVVTSAAVRRDQAALRAAVAEDEDEGKERMAGASWVTAVGFAVVVVRRRHAKPTRPRATPSSASVPGSGTGAAEISLGAVIGEAEAVGSKTNVPPAPIAKLPPAGNASGHADFQRAQLDDCAARIAVAACQNQSSAADLRQAAQSAEHARECRTGVVVAHDEGQGSGGCIAQDERPLGQSVRQAWRRSAYRSSEPRCRCCPACYPARREDYPTQACHR